jgi:hypothetical protein
MENHKVTSYKSNKEFIVTESFIKLTKKFKSLKNTRGRIILVIGAPGTGKSSNVYHALKTVDLKYYEPILLIDNDKMSSKSVYNRINDILYQDLYAKTEDEVFSKMAKFDAVLVADKFLDSEYINKSKIGLAEWVSHKTILTIPFYVLWIIKALRYRNSLKKINLIFQTAWTIQIRGFKYDIITDFGIFSTILQELLKKLFEVVKIEYTDAETIKIVKSHIKSINLEEIRYYIKKYENKPRYILNELEETD